MSGGENLLEEALTNYLPGSTNPSMQILGKRLTPNPRTRIEKTVQVNLPSKRLKRRNEQKTSQEQGLYLVGRKEHESTFLIEPMTAFDTQPNIMKLLTQVFDWMMLRI